jgi:hypothetical protein
MQLFFRLNRPLASSVLAATTATLASIVRFHQTDVLEL